ncbi:MAG: C-GCAxxG-C-C family protein [Bacteroidales bacterium]|nr:C-GCAxxG-C-C family protein [Bacteroidales bacterium]
MDSHTQTAMNYFGQGYNCAQSVFAAYSDRTKIGDSQSLKIATAFGGGIADTQKTCGAISGALMVLGASLYNPDNPVISKDIVKQYSQTLINLIEEKYSTSHCAELIKIDFSKDNPLEENQQKEKDKICLQVIEDVCIILDQMVKSQNAGLQ